MLVSKTLEKQIWEKEKMQGIYKVIFNINGDIVNPVKPEPLSLRYFPDFRINKYRAN